MPIVAAFAVPHPPILLPEVGHGEEKKIQRTTQAYAEVVQRIVAQNPDVLLIVSPHATLYADYFHLSPGREAQGNLSQFGAPEVALRAVYDQALVKRIEACAQRWEIPAGTAGERDAKLDHGTLIPLWLLAQAGFSCPIVRIGLSGLPVMAHYHLGQCLADATDALNRRAVLIASGDCSHKLTHDGPYGFAKEGAAFDRLLTDAFCAGDFLSLLSISPQLAEASAECGWRSFQIMAGTLDRRSVTPELLSYEGPFGVGYSVAAFTVTGADASRNFGEQFEHARNAKISAVRNQEDAYVKLARQSLETRVVKGLAMALPDTLSPELLHTRAGVFVSIHKDGELRGCIGTISPTEKSIAKEIARNAVSAGCNDPRFEPVREEELPLLTYHVDVLGQPESIRTESDLDPKKYGVIVQNGSRRGLLLPDLEGVDTAAEQVAIARRKAGIQAKEPVQLYRFEVVRHR